jgi:hypothetical protein
MMFGLSFLSPLFLLAAAAVAVPIALHLLRRRTEVVVDFPAMRLLQKAPVEQQRRRRLRELVLLALRVSALLLLALAFARPYIARAVAVLPAPVTVVALDTSLSLSAPGQFDRARAAARDAVQNAPGTHAVALIAFADAASVVVPSTTDRGAVVAAIDALSPGAGGTRYRTALARAAEAVGREGRIVVVTDLQQAGWEAGDEGAVPDGVDVSVVEVPPPTGNVAVTAAHREGQTIVAAIHNFGQRPVRVPVELRVGEQALASQVVEVASQAAAEVRLTAALPATGAGEVVIEDLEGYAGDNSRFVVLDPPGAVPVMVVTADPPVASTAGLYVERALTVAEDGRAFQAVVLDGRAFSALSDEQFGEPGAIILLGTRTLERAGRQRLAGFLRDGGRVLLTLGPDVDVETLTDTVGTPIEVESSVAVGTEAMTLIAVDTRHPVFRPFLNPTGAIGTVSIEQYRRLKDQQAGRVVLARFSGAGPALTEEAVGRGRLLVFASDLDNRWNRFPLNPAFVPWAVEMARYLTQGREARQSYTLPDIPAGVPSAPGVYELGAAGAATEGRKSRETARIAVNPDVRESNPARISADEFDSSITRLHAVSEIGAGTEARVQEERQRLWQIGLLLMFVALAGEGLIGRKAI